VAGNIWQALPELPPLTSLSSLPLDRLASAAPAASSSSSSSATSAATAAAAAAFGLAAEGLAADLTPASRLFFPPGVFLALGSGGVGETGGLPPSRAPLHFPLHFSLTACSYS